MFYNFIFFFSYAWLALDTAKIWLKTFLTAPFFLSVWPQNNAVLTNTIQSFSPRTIYQPERLSKLIMSLPFFSPAHSQAKKRDKGVSLTSRSLPSSSCQKDLTASLCCLWIFQVEHREKSTGDKKPLHGSGEKNLAATATKSKKIMALSCDFLLGPETATDITLPKSYYYGQTAEWKWKYIICLYFVSLENKCKVKRNLKEKYTARKLIENAQKLSQAFLKYLYLRLQMSQISLFSNYLLSKWHWFQLYDEKRMENILRQKNWWTSNNLWGDWKGWSLSPVCPHLAKVQWGPWEQWNPADHFLDMDLHSACNHEKEGSF